MVDISKATSGEVVTVACKIPAGLVLRVFEMVPQKIPMGNGSFVDGTIAKAREDTVTLRGFAHPQDRAANHPIIGGFGLTFGVPKEFWDLWRLQNKDSDIVRNELVFARVKSGAAEGDAKERAEVLSGLERLDPNKPPPGIVPGTMDQAA